jgi:hypothetical protein
MPLNPRFCSVLKLFTAALLVAVLGACALLQFSDAEPPARPQAPPVRVTGVDALYENISPSFWPPGSAERGFSLFLNLWIHLDADAGFRGSIREVRVYDPFDNYWTLEAGIRAVREGEPVGGWLRLRDGFMSDNGSMLALRGMRLHIELSDGTLVTEPLAFPPPASSTPNERFLVSETYRGELTADHAFALARAQIIAARLDADTIRAELGPVDRRATNGRLVLLSADRRVLAESPAFYNDVSREPRRFLNGGTRLRSDAPNIVSLPLSELVWVPGATPVEARYVYVKLRDGGQYAFTRQSESYLHLSRSELHELSGSGR